MKNYDIKRQYDEQMANTYQHDLINPLNEIVQQSRHLRDKASVATDTKEFRQEFTFMTDRIWCNGKMLQYLVLSIINEKKFSTASRMLSVYEIKTSQIVKQVNDLLDAFQLQIQGTRLKI